MTVRYQFIAAPADSTKQQTIDKLRQKVAVGAEPMAELAPFDIPDFKIGTLDSLMVLTDDLLKIDLSIEATIGKIIDFIKALTESGGGDYKTSLVVNDRSVDSSVKNFKWNGVKYRTDKATLELAEAMSQEVASIENTLKNKMITFSSIKNTLAGIERKQTGNLSVKALNDVVRRENFVLDSEYLQTVLVAVPKHLQKEWLMSYETLTQMVVPRSCIKIAEDEDFCLYGVTVFQRVIEDFVNQCREARFTPRDFVYDEQAMMDQKKEAVELGAQAKEQSASLLRVCKVNFSEVFSTWLHIKALRVYVEAILRYGLPPNFQGMVLKSSQKTERKVRDTLMQHYAFLGSSMAKGKKGEALEEIQGLSFDKEYFPYVNFDLNWAHA